MSTGDFAVVKFATLPSTSTVELREHDTMLPLFDFFFSYIKETLTQEVTLMHSYEARDGVLEEISSYRHG